MENENRIWIVGGSSGIGFELVKLLLQDGFYLVVSSRAAQSNKALKDLKKQFPSNISLINLDVSQNNFTKTIKEVLEVYSGLDIWFYNAASYEVMGIDSWDINKFIQMSNTNYLGAVKIMTELISYFKEQKKGRWIWNLSLSSYFGLPKGGAYSAPKAALLNLAQSLHPELKQKNINLQIINHGFVKTRLTAKNDFKMPQLMSSKFTAQKIFEAIKSSKDFEIRFPMKLALFLQFLSWLPYKISLKITKNMLS